MKSLFQSPLNEFFSVVARHSHHSSSIIINLRFRSSFSSFSNAKPTLVSLLNRVLENHHHNRQFTFVHFFKLPLKIQYILKVITVIWKSRKMSHFTILRAKRASFVCVQNCQCPNNISVAPIFTPRQSHFTPFCWVSKVILPPFCWVGKVTFAPFWWVGKVIYAPFWWVGKVTFTPFFLGRQGQSHFTLFLLGR